MRDRKPFQADPHALDRKGPGHQGLLGEDAQELFAAVAVERVSPASMVLELGRDSLKDLVTGLVTVGVVVGLEVIDVEQSHAVAVPIAGHARLQQVEILIEGPAVTQSGERVPSGDGGELVVQTVPVRCAGAPAGGAKM